MAISIELKWDERDLDVFRGTSLEKDLVKHLRNAGDRAMRRMVTDGIKAIRSKKRLKEAYLRDNISLQRPGQKATLDSLVWTIRVRGKPIPLAEYAYRQTKTGVTVNVNTSGSAKIAHAFVATVGAGHVGIFMRRGKARLPIRELFSAKLTDVLLKEGVIDELFAPAKQVLTAAFEKAVADWGKR